MYESVRSFYDRHEHALWLMMLAAGPGATLHLTAQGPQGPEALQALIALVEGGFEEECIDDA